MGNRFSRRRDAPASSAETAAPEQKTAEEPAATQPAEGSGITQTQEAVVVVGEQVTVTPSLPTEVCASECKEADAPAAPAPLNDAEPESVAKETPAPVEPEPLVTISEPSPPESKPVAEAQPEPEPVTEPEPTSNPDAKVEAVTELISDSVAVPAEALEQQTESLPEPEISSPPLIDLGVPDATPQPINTPPSPADIPAPVYAEEPSDIPMAEEGQDSTEVSVISTSEPEKSEETSESLEKLMEVEAGGNLEQLVSDINEESVSELLQNLELKGSDLDTDLIPADVKIPGDAPITVMSTPTELM